MSDTGPWVEPRQFSGILLHNLPAIRNPYGEVYCELYVNDPSPENKVGLYKHGTRIISDMTTLDDFSGTPWNSDLLEGIIDVSFLQLTPGTRDGFIYDAAYDSFTISLRQIEEHLLQVLAEHKRAEEEKVSRSILLKISRAVREALLFLPLEEYSWLQVQEGLKTKVVRVQDAPGGGESAAEGASGAGSAPGAGDGQGDGGEDDGAEAADGEGTMESVVMPFTEAAPRSRGTREFFEFPGPMHSAVISPSSTVLRVGDTRTFQVKVRDRKRVQVEDDCTVRWKLGSGLGRLSGDSGQFVEFTAGDEPGIELLHAEVVQRDLSLTCQATITVTQELFGNGDRRNAVQGTRGGRGLPGYTFSHCPGELWRSRYDSERMIIIINSGHADYLFAAQANTRKLRYITKLYAKELVLINFPEADRDRLLERLIELQLYIEENL